METVKVSLERCAAAEKAVRKLMKSKRLKKRSADTAKSKFDVRIVKLGKNGGETDTGEETDNGGHRLRLCSDKDVLNVDTELPSEIFAIESSVESASRTEVTVDAEQPLLPAEELALKHIIDSVDLTEIYGTFNDFYKSPQIFSGL